MRRIGAAAFAVLMLLTACSPSVSQPDARKEDSLQVTRTDLFQGESEKFKPFLGTHAGAVKLKYDGPDAWIQVDVEVWESGVKVETPGGWSTEIAKLPNEKTASLDGELIVSIYQKNTDSNETQYDIRSAITKKGKGFSSSAQTIAARTNLTGSSPLVLNKDVQIEPHGSAYVWGMQATDGNSIRTYGSIEEALERSRWAIAFKVTMTDAKGTNKQQKLLKDEEASTAVADAPFLCR